jgi:hypothetical protein
MPDADDFDVEYFRTLLKGGAAKEKAGAPAPAKKAARPCGTAGKRGAAAKPKKRPAR